MSQQEEIRRALYEQTLEGDVKEAGRLTDEALALGVGPASLLFEVLIPALDEVGRRFEAGEFFVPEMLMAAKAMQEAMQRLRPLLAETGVQLAGTILMMTVKGDVHDIGKNLVNLMLEGAGFQVIDLGVDVAPEKMIAAVADEFFASFLDGWDPGGETFTPEFRQYYIDASRRAVPSIVADYRATAGIDLEIDRADRDAGKQLTMPVGVISQDWGTQLGFDATDIWRAWAPNLTYLPINAGHFMAEEAPTPVTAFIRQLLEK
jgi:pimeloyl-ACP methyl ester carboxylesterase